FPMGKYTVVDSWVRFVDEQLRRERACAGESFDLLISDRTVVDTVGYATVNQSFRPFIPNYFVSMLKEVALRSAAYYDLFAFFPIEFPMTADGVRYDDEEYRKAVDLSLREFLQQEGFDLLYLTGSVEERFNTLMQHLPEQLRSTISPIP